LDTFSYIWNGYKSENYYHCFQTNDKYYKELATCVLIEIFTILVVSKSKTLQSNCYTQHYMQVCRKQLLIGQTGLLLPDLYIWIHVEVCKTHALHVKHANARGSRGHALFEKSIFWDWICWDFALFITAVKVYNWYRL